MSAFDLVTEGGDEDEADNAYPAGLSMARCALKAAILSRIYSVGRAPIRPEQRQMAERSLRVWRLMDIPRESVVNRAHESHAMRAQPEEQRLIV